MELVVCWEIIIFASVLIFKTTLKKTEETIEIMENIEEQTEADKALKKLGYEKIKRYEYYLEYQSGNIYISFSLKKKTVSCYQEIYLGKFIYREMTIEELEAIMLKCQELGWRK